MKEAFEQGKNLGEANPNLVDDLDVAIKEGDFTKVEDLVTQHQLKKLTNRSQNELDELAIDPAHGKMTPSSIHEQEIGLILEKSGKLTPPIKRDPTGAAEFIDGNGVSWDIKSFNSNFPPNKGGFFLERDFQKIQQEIRLGENVIVDTGNMTNEHIQLLKAKIIENQLELNVIFYP